MSDKTIRGLGCLDILFTNVRRYRQSDKAKALYEFTASFPRLAPLNALLVHIQKPYSRMVATAIDWKLKYGRKLKFNATPLIILWPFGPVNFVFDISDTEETENASEIPEEILKPFQPQGYLPNSTLRYIYENLPALGILETRVNLGALAGGSIQPMRGQYYQRSCGNNVKILYAIKLRRDIDELSRFSILVHELGHLYCGHLNAGGKDKRFPARAELYQKERKEKIIIQEFEAESVAWLVCRRLGLDAPADLYLSSYWKEKDKELPEISLNTIFWAAGKIETLCKQQYETPREFSLELGTPEANGYREWDEYDFLHEKSLPKI